MWNCPPTRSDSSTRACDDELRWIPSCATVARTLDTMSFGAWSSQLPMRASAKAMIIVSFPPLGCTTDGTRKYKYCVPHFVVAPPRNTVV